MIPLLLLILAAPIGATTVFPTAAKNHRLLTHDLSWQATGGEPIYLTELKPIFETVTELLNDPEPGVGMKFGSVDDFEPPGQGQNPATAHKYVFSPRTEQAWNGIGDVHFLRTDIEQGWALDQYVKVGWNYNLYNPEQLNENCEEECDRDLCEMDCYTPTGQNFEKDFQTCTECHQYSQAYPASMQFAACETGPAMLMMRVPDVTPSDGYVQSLELHAKWNLVSWHLDIPDPDPIYSPYIRMDEILPDDPSGLNDWFFDNDNGQVFRWLSRSDYYPDNPPESAEWPWNLNYAYCLNLKSAASWGFADLERFTLNAVNDFDPDPAWDSNVLDPNSLATEWFFMGYAAPGYCKLASISMIGPQPPSGDPQYFQYEGPFHWLIWYNSDDPEHPEYPDNFPRWDLRVVRDDEGRFYIQDPDPVNHRQFPIDQIGTLIPGKGYYLGFNADPNETYDFAGWINWPQWRDGDYVPPEPPSNQRGTASGAHFQYTKYTQWAYPVIIDTVDLGQCPMSLGDEIGVFDGDLCVGSAAYPDSFPLVITCWEDDIATPSELDGYLWNNPMTFIWYDASANAEVEFQLPPETQAAENDAIAPEHSGFGRGFFAKRSFTNGVSTVTPLPQEYKIRQNFPNPFNAETVIPLELPQRSKIRLEIYNVNGQRLGLPFEHTYDAGWPKIRWNAAKLPSGIYFYRITAEGLERGGIFVDAGKMLVLK